MPLQKGSAFQEFLCNICLCRMKEAYSGQDAHAEVTELFLREQIVTTQIF